MRTATVIALCLLTTACGSDTEQRTASGALFGLGLGALAGGPVGAAIGLGAGIIAGAVTPVGADTAAQQALGYEKKTIASTTGIGGTATTSGSSTPPSKTTGGGAPLHVSPDTVRHIQSNLQAQNLYTGPIDGIVGPKTRNALREYQQQQGLTPTGDIDTTTLQRLNGSASLSGSSGASAAAGSASDVHMMTMDQVAGQLQSRGYSTVTDMRPSGRYDYTALATEGDKTYVVAVDGRSGQVLSRRPAPAGVQPSSGTTQPGSQMPPNPAAPSPTQSDQ